MKQRVTTIFLKIVTVLIGIASLISDVFLLPKLANAMSVLMPTVTFFKLPFLICMCAIMIIFFSAPYRAIKLLHYIDNGKVLSDAPIKTLKNMEVAGTLITVLFYLADMPAVYLVAQMENAPDPIIIGSGMAPMLSIVATLVAAF